MKFKSIILVFVILASVVLYPQNDDTLETDSEYITARTVINKYIDAIGGMDKFKSVKDRTTVMTGTAMSQPIKIIIKQKYPDKLFQDLQAGEVDQFLYYSNGNGTMVIGDKRITLEGKELERLKVDAAMQFLLDPESYNVKSDFMGIECLDSTDCLVIRFILPSGIRWFQYYSEETGLKIKETKEIQTNQGLFDQETHFSDYREVDGIKYPFSMTQYFGNQIIDLTVDSIEINTGLDDKIFEVPE